VGKQSKRELERSFVPHEKSTLHDCKETLNQATRKDEDLTIATRLVSIFIG
jgi:hypothetical protein